MREILFRGKRKDNGEWVCSGNLIQFFDNNIREVYISQYGERCNAVHDIDTDNIETITCENGARFYKVIPETVGQYTGLTDKNGNKIFEGDVVHAIYSDRYIGVPDTDYGNLIVGFDDTYYGGARYSMKIIGDTGYRIFSAGLRNGVTVIGNIHDNPELLKVGDDT